MRPTDSHISDQDLLRCADGELPFGRHWKASAHLASCCVCRDRMRQLEATMADFIQLHRRRRLPSPEGPAALLKASLSTTEHTGGAPGMLATLALLMLFAAAIFFAGKQGRVVEASSVPRTDLTPGATTAITRGEACQVESGQANREVPVALQEAVFKEYGIAHPRPSAYEVDYLITPELGGANDIRNLWPEPYYSQVWNARVKDALEDRLHQMVCNGQLDLATAQHDISADWIGAYKKYFHTNRPLPVTPRH